VEVNVRLVMCVVVDDMGDRHRNDAKKYELQALGVLYIPEIWLIHTRYVLLLWKKVIKQVWPSSEVDIQIC